eukprot:Transcript_25399.p1 GENE.Transcript_25399~~Transcript_25399.p1  ORF type:complete len:451 (-),score=175.48 Transcript_25399:78-1430(-)
MSAAKQDADAAEPIPIDAESAALQTAFESPAPRTLHDDGATPFLSSLLSRHDVSGVSVALICPADAGGGGRVIQTVCAGQASRGCDAPMTPTTWLQYASLSKTVGTAFALETFATRGLLPTNKVNAVLEQVGSTFRLRAAPGADPAWADGVTLAHLVNHTGLGMHYVNGVPPSAAGGMPSALALLTGVHEQDYGYAPLLVTKAPGTKFGYSGGGFILLQLILEELLGLPIDVAIAPFLIACGAQSAAAGGMTLRCAPQLPRPCAQGYLDDGAMVRDGRLNFPPLAAGAHGSPAALAAFLYHLASAYRAEAGSGPIAHATARAMLDGAQDLGCVDFMASRIGLGVFVARAGDNRLMLHQAANDGFRGVFVVCFDGPDAEGGPVGFVLLCNGDNKGMFMNCELCLALLRRLRLRGMDWAAVEGRTFDPAETSQEQIVNLGLKSLVFAAFGHQ